MEIGDIFYTYLQQTEYYAGGFYAYKLLVDDVEAETWHLLPYEPLNTPPTNEDIVHLKLRAWHCPIYSKGFKEITIIGNRPVTNEELKGYREYLKQMQEL